MQAIQVYHCDTQQLARCPCRVLSLVIFPRVLVFRRRRLHVDLSVAQSNAADFERKLREATKTVRLMFVF